MSLEFILFKYTIISIRVYNHFNLCIVLFQIVYSFISYCYSVLIHIIYISIFTSYQVYSFYSYCAQSFVLFNAYSWILYRVSVLCNIMIKVLFHIVHAVLFHIVYTVFFLYICLIQVKMGNILKNICHHYNVICHKFINVNQIRHSVSGGRQELEQMHVVQLCYLFILQ